MYKTLSFLIITLAAKKKKLQHFIVLHFKSHRVLNKRKQIDPVGCEIKFISAFILQRNNKIP